MIHPILDRMAALGLSVFTDGDWNLNIVGIRKNNGTPDSYDDWLHVLFKVDGAWRDRFWPVTTDPGLYYLMSKDRQINPAGTAVLVPGQYRGAYKIAKHGKSGYEALCQRNGKVKVWRDNNHDDNLIDGLDIVAAVGVFDNTEDRGSNGHFIRIWENGEYINASASATNTGTVGFYAVHYVNITDA